MLCRCVVCTRGVLGCNVAVKGDASVVHWVLVAAANKSRMSTSRCFLRRTASVPRLPLFRTLDSSYKRNMSSRYCVIFVSIRLEITHDTEHVCECRLDQSKAPNKLYQLRQLCLNWSEKKVARYCKTILPRHCLRGECRREA